MEIQYTALLNSRYSKPCQNFLNILFESGIDYKNLLKFVQINIDNKEIRKQILNSNNIDIKYVPCILIIYSDGSVEKYEGNDSFKWLDEIISNNLTIQMNNNYPSQINNDQQESQSSEQQPKKVSKHVKELESSSQMTSQMIVPKSVNNQIDTPSMAPPKTVPEESTPIEDISEDDNMDIDDIFPPKYASLRTGAASYEVTPSTFGKKDMVQKVTRGIKQSTDMPGTKKTDIMSTALAMQKLREKEDEGMPRGPAY